MKVVMQKGELLRVELTNGNSMLISDDGKTSTMPTEWENHATNLIEETTARQKLLDSARHLNGVSLPVRRAWSASNRPGPSNLMGKDSRDPIEECEYPKE